MREVKTLNEDFRSDLLILRWFLNGPKEKVTFKLCLMCIETDGLEVGG